MAEPAEEWVVSHLDVSHLTTEDDAPVDSFFQERQMSILTEALRVSWDEGRPFLSGADVGLFSRIDQEAIVPDVLLSVGVEMPEDFHAKEKRSYFIWNFGKPPDVVIEIVSNKKGDEDTRKLSHYARIKVPYYVIFDPDHYLSGRTLRVFQLSGGSYIEKVDAVFPEVGLSLVEWPGRFDQIEANWLRWATMDGQLLPVGAEVRATVDEERAKAEEASARAEEASARAEEASARAEEASAKLERLAEKLKSLGVDPDSL